MVNFEIFLFGLLITSTLTGLATEAVKKILTERNISYKANTLAGIMSLIVSAAIAAGYIVLFEIAFTSQIAVYMVAHVFMSWLCAMVGYDKVIQTIGQFKTTDK